MLRYFKIILVVFVGLNGFIYFAANIANFEAARGAVSAVISMPERPWYPVALVPAMEGAAAATLALSVILTGEFLVGALSLLGAWKMFAAVNKPPAEFHASKTLALAGCAMALVVWFGGFTVIGGALFQMWQTELGQSSLGDALKFFAGSGIVLLWLSVKEE
jgi:predicted small integral membrane protein